MNKITKTIVLVLTTALAFCMVTGYAAEASSTVPKSLRHEWYQPLKNVKDPMFIKLKSHAMDSGSKAFHHKISGKDLQVIKKSKGWYQIGYTGNNNPTYKVTRRKVSGKKRTVLLKKNSSHSHYADVFLIGKKTKMNLGESSVYLG